MDQALSLVLPSAMTDDLLRAIICSNSQNTTISMDCDSRNNWLVTIDRTIPVASHQMCQIDAYDTNLLSRQVTRTLEDILAGLIITARIMGGLRLRSDVPKKMLALEGTKT